MTGRLPPRLDHERGGSFLLHGDDEFRKSEVERALCDRYLDPATRDFNFDLLRGGEIGPESLIAVLTTPPMMAEWRVVLLRDTQRLASGAKTRRALLAVVESMPAGLVVVMSYSLSRGRQPKFFKDLRKASASAEFNQLSDYKLHEWVISRVGELGGKIQPEAARAVTASSGNDLGILAQELDKLVSVAGDGPVTVDTVRAAGVRVPAMDRWRWFDLIGDRSFDAALNSLWDVLNQSQTGRSESVVGLVSGLTTHFLRLGLAAEGGRRQLASALSRQSWLVDRIVRQSRRWSAAEIEAALEGLIRLDRLLKASAHSDVHYLEEWLLARKAHTSVRAARPAA